MPSISGILPKVRQPRATSFCSIRARSSSPFRPINGHGVGFLLSQQPATPLNLPIGVSSNFTVTFAPQAAASYTGTLTIGTQGLTQTFVLTGTAYNPPLPTPALQFDTNTPQSGQQVTLTMTLPSPAPVAASGSVNLTFQPDLRASPGLSVAIPRSSSSSTVRGRFHFRSSKGQRRPPSRARPAQFFKPAPQREEITFTVTTTSRAPSSAAIQPLRSLLAPLPVQIGNAAATTALASALNIQVWGFDNTYSAGTMSFTFYDDSGNAIGAGLVMANFVHAFLNYFATSTDAGSFAMLVTFPITGNAAEVGSVNVQLTNSAGTSTISQLAFLNDTGTCVLVAKVLTCP